MATGDKTEFDCQMMACNEFFNVFSLSALKPLAEEEKPDSMKRYKGRPVYDISGFDAQQVVEVLSAIINDKDQFTSGKTFYLLIYSNSEYKSQAEIEEQLFRLEARPTKDQPGNGIVVLRPKGKSTFTEPPKNYAALSDVLTAHYGTNTKSFAKDINNLLKDNKLTKDIPEATIEVYMLLLFEIARRLVKSENPVSDRKPGKKEEYDVLPIGSAIARFIKLFKSGKYRFEDVFLEGATFNCFSGKPQDRRRAIKAINKATAQNELQELFQKKISSEKEDQLAKTLKDMCLNETWSDEESYTDSV